MICTARIHLDAVVDTWGWLALADRRDAKHKAAAECYAQQSREAGRIVTSDFVLDELLTLLFARRPFDEAAKFANALLASPLVAIEWVTAERFNTALQLRLKFSDKPKLSFTDLTSIVIMKELRITDVMTPDSHFVQVGLGFRLLPL